MEKAKKKKETTEVKKQPRKISKLIFDIVFWIVILALLFIWITDFIKTQNEKKPIFCIKNIVHEYKDGKTYECVGLGYKVYTYDRTTLKIKSQFSPFFIKMEE